MTNTSQSLPPLSAAELDDIGTELNDLMLTIARFTARKTELENTLKERADYGTFAAGPLTVTVGRNVTRDSKAIERDFPFESHPDLYKPTLDGDAIKKEFTGAQIEHYQITGAPKLIVKTPKAV